MKRTRFTQEQIVYALRQAEAGTPVEEIPARWGSVRPRFIAGGKSSLEWV